MFGSLALSQAPTTSSILHNEDVVKMVKAGLSAPIIVSTIKGQPVSFALSSNDLITLKASGVPDDIVSRR